MFVATNSEKGRKKNLSTSLVLLASADTIAIFLNFDERKDDRKGAPLWARVDELGRSHRDRDNGVE